MLSPLPRGRGRGLGREDIQSYSCLLGRFQRIEGKETAELGVKNDKKEDNKAKVAKRQRGGSRALFKCPPSST